MSEAEADRLLDRGAAYVRDRVGESVYGEDSTDLAAVVLDACRANELHIGVAESCTGGLLGARLTAISGSSDVVIGGVIAYSDAIKRDLLGVLPATLREHGAVSEPVVRAMAAGVRDRCGTEIGLAITGIAGPTGGTTDKPVGTVWICCDLKGSVETRLLHLWGDRAEVRARSAQATLELLRRMLSRQAGSAAS
jgi:PncC family amidohydrolase